MPVFRRDDMTPVSGSSYPAPFNEGMGNYRAWAFSNAAGLTQFGVAYEELAPGAAASQRHWHEGEDEFLYMLKGELILIEQDGEHVLTVGDAAAWKAGTPNGHHVINRSSETAAYIIVGTKAETDICHYPDIDLKYTRENGESRFTHKDGTPFDGDEHD